jgi:signal transduction histidine kinase/integral membrane sensor domain MASE1
VTAETTAATVRDGSSKDWTPVGAALAMGVTYYAGAHVGLAFTYDPLPLALLWPPNALLMAGLAIAPLRLWWTLLAGAFAAHLVAELQGGVAVEMVLCWFLSNVAEAVLGATLLRRFGRVELGLSSVQAAMTLVCAALVAPLLSSFLDAGFVRAVGWSDASYWTLVQARFFSNLLAVLTIVPLVLSWAARSAQSSRHPSQGRAIEGATLLMALMVACIFAFDRARLGNSAASAVLLYLPIPMLIWASLRFGPRLTSTAFALMSVMVIWGLVHGRGPFSNHEGSDSVIPVQVFLIVTAVLLLILAALVEEWRHAEFRLGASEVLFATAFKASPDAMSITRRCDGSPLEENDRWIELFGASPSPGGRPGTCLGAEHVGDTVAEALLGGEGLDDTELSIRDRHGRTRQVLLRSKHVELRGQACSIHIVRDISQLRQAEHKAKEQRQQLTHLTRIASLNDFSGTLAHELNQPLTAILSNAQAALRFLAQDPPNLADIRTILSEIAESDKRAGLLIHHMRLLMKRGEEEFAPIRLDTLVKEVLTLTHGELVMRNIMVRTAFPHELPSVIGDRVQLQQLLLNLVMNACDAMKTQAHRVLTITTLHGQGGMVQVAVTDSGTGIPEDRLEKIFEPFFTTKASGLGLGLAICRDIAEAHGGRLVAESRAGEGATFRLSVPERQNDSVPTPLSKSTATAHESAEAQPTLAPKMRRGAANDHRA